MTPAKPYLVRAFYDWIVDNGCTPHILVDAEGENVKVPESYIQDGKIILNIAPRAVRDLQLNNHNIEFTARFSGVTRQINVPICSVLAIYAFENGRGMVLSDEDEEDDDLPPPTTDGDKMSDKPGKGDKAGRPNLRVVK